MVVPLTDSVCDVRPVLRQFWGLDGEVALLEGEYDANYRLDSGDGRFLLKVMRPDCQPDFVHMQIGAIERLRSAEPFLPVPGVVLGRSGEALVDFEDKTGARRIAWMQEWLPGKRLTEIQPRSTALLAALGRVAGRVTSGLESFDHPLLVRRLKWNPLQSDWIERHVSSIAIPNRRGLICSVLNDFRAIEKRFRALPTQAIQNDMNDCNLLVTDGPDDIPVFSGILDFGDMCRAPRVCELATAAAYALLSEQEIEPALAAIVAGFHSVNPLSAAEVDLLWPLLRMRLAVSVVNSSLMARQRPDDPYVTISQAPAWEFLESSR